MVTRQSAKGRAGGPDTVCPSGSTDTRVAPAALRELEELDDEERRETGGWELARQLTLAMEDGSVVGWRSSTGTAWSVSALE
jgi:hypothetical protein